MINVLIILFGVIGNFIVYLSFGSLITGVGKGRKASQTEDNVRMLLVSVVLGFFFYYFLFFFVCVPPMAYYRPLSMLTGIWVPIVIAVILISAFFNGRRWIAQIKGVFDAVRREKVAATVLLVIVAIQVFLVACTYNFTLDAAYYVANVATSVDTNMMNVYDPFTGAWQDHYEMGYFFATYSMQDSVVCRLTGIPALIWTKSVMAITIILLTNIIYILIARELFDRPVSVIVMVVCMFVVNMTFTTIYTSSMFLITRTYEGKAIVGNLALMTVFYLFMRMNDGSGYSYLKQWLMLFIVCFGATTISSSANMLIPVELTVLFVPLIIRKKLWKQITGYVICVIPGLAFALVFVLYVKGYFVLYTFPK